MRKPKIGFQKVKDKAGNQVRGLWRREPTFSARLFVSRDTLWRMERGDPTVSVGTLATALFVLQLHERLADLAAPAEDALALSLDEAHLPKRIRGRRA